MTEALLDVEPFIKADHDTEALRPLLVALGVRDTPAGPDRLLERLRAISQSDAPPVSEVLKWYRRLDSVAARCSVVEMAEIISAFKNQKLILTESVAWASAEEVFLRADEAVVPDIATVHPLAQDLPLWDRVGVAQRPTAELVLAWLKGIESGGKISGDEDRRVREALARHAERVWNEAGHWLNLNGEWTPATQLTYKLAVTVSGPWAHLFPAVRSQTADLRMLAEEVRQSQVFADLRALSSAVEERLVTPPDGHGVPEHKRWLTTLGEGLAMAVFEDEERTRCVRDVGLRLLRTLWLPVMDLQLIAYIDGLPAGTARTAVAHWEDPSLYVEDLPVARTCKAVTAELCRRFDDTDVTEAIKICFEREPAFIMEYLEENFQLDPADMPAAVQPAVGANTMETSALEDQLGRALDEPTFPGEAPAGWQEEVPTWADRSLVPGSQLDDVKVDADRRPPGPAQPSLIERYAKATGYRADQRAAEFIHPNGSRLRQTSDSPFRWQKWSPDGEVVQSYWVKDHCLHGGPMEITAEVMDLCSLHPEEYSLIIAAQDGHPLVLSGRVLARLRGEGQISVYPAGYRIVLEDPDSWPPSD